VVKPKILKVVKFDTDAVNPIINGIP